MNTVHIVKRAAMAAAIIIALCSCSQSKEVQYETIDNEWFSCQLVYNWDRAESYNDGDMFIKGRIWYRSSPDKDNECSISVNFYDDCAENIMAINRRETDMSIPSPDGTYNFVAELGSADGESTYMLERWGFVKGSDLVEVCFQYPKTCPEETRDLYRSVAETTVKSMKLK